jgi:hypothetical protein
MSADALLFAVGGLLLVTGLLGGGFELRELKIPKVGRIARVCATGAGGLCILLGLGLSTAVTETPIERADATTGPVASPTPGETPDEPVHFVIRDELGDAQVSEQVSVVLDGRRVGDLTVNSEYPQSQLELTVDGGDRLDYTISASSLEYDAAGDAVYRDGSGQGSFVPEAGASYHIEYGESGDRRDLALVAD